LTLGNSFPMIKYLFLPWSKTILCYPCCSLSGVLWGCEQMLDLFLKPYPKMKEQKARRQSPTPVTHNQPLLSFQGSHCAESVSPTYFQYNSEVSQSLWSPFSNTYLFQASPTPRAIRDLKKSQS
jgi:hypothetical protein